MEINLRENEIWDIDHLTIFFFDLLMLTLRPSNIPEYYLTCNQTKKLIKNVVDIFESCVGEN